MHGEPLRGIVVQKKGKQTDKKDRGAWKESPKKCPLTYSHLDYRSKERIHQAKNSRV